MKIEFLHHYRKRHGLTLRDRLIAYLPRYAPLASRFAPLVNALQYPARTALGFARQRVLPRWRRDAFREEPSTAVPSSGCFAPEIGEKAGGNRREMKDVVVFIDTFNRYFEPENARAALAVLRAAGYTVHFPQARDGSRPLCCGRTFLAGGLVHEAKVEAQRMLEALQPFVERGMSVVGLEPSCLFSLRDEFLSLLPGSGTSRLASNAMAFEEFLAREHDAGRLDLTLKPLPQKKALLHGHCHQKAFSAMGAVQRVLQLIPGLDVEPIESSCCGMAGSFGYHAEHYEVSMKMAQLSLLPKVRKAGDDILLVADGTSCRHQIRDGAQREALHVARVIQAALGPG